MPDDPITKLANAIKRLITDHDKQASSSQRGHATAGGTPQAIGDDLSAGTDNGYYARADHIHTASWTNLKNKPTIPTSTSDLTNDSGFSTFSGDYTDLTNKPSYTPTITSATSSSYVIGTINISGTDETIYGKDVNSNTLGFQIRTNSMEITPTDKTYRYRLLLQTGDNNKYMPVNTSTSTAHNTSKTSTMNTREFLLGGDIRYYSGSTAIAVGSVFSATNVMQQYNITLGYSFNNTSTDLTLSDNIPVYMVVQQSSTNPSMAKLASPFYTQTLPNTEDGLLYVQLGYATAATTMELTLDHPIFHYKDGKVQLFSPNNHTHSQYSTFSGNYNDLTNKPTIPSASSTTPSADTASGSVGSGTTWAKADHTHPKSTLYAESSHSHSYNDLSNKPTIPDVSGKIDTAGTGLSKSGTTLNHSNSITALTTATLKKVKYDAQGHITGVADVTASDLPSHTHNYSTFSGNYDDLNNKPDIPSATSDLTNDGNGSEPFLTHSDISAVGISGKASDLNNDSGFLTSHNPIDSSLSSSSENAVQNKVINTALGNKVDKVSGKGLSTNDFDATYKGYVDNLVSSSNTTKNAHVHGSIGSGGTLNSDITSVNKIAVTDSSNNLKTISQLPYNKISGTPDIPQSLGDLELEEGTSINVSSGNILADYDSVSNSVSLLDGMLYYDMGNQQIIYNNTDIIATLSDIPSIPTVPTASTTTPSADTTSGSYGSGTSYARSNHTHPKSSLYAEANHTHSQYANIEDIPTHLENLTLSDDESISSEDGHSLINNQTSGDYIGFADDLLTYDTANSVLNYNAYELATVNDIPTKTNQLTNNSGFLTSHQSLTPTRVYNCSSWNSSYIDTSSTNQLMLYKLGDSLYFLRYFIATKNLVYSTTDYNINSDSIPSDYRPAGDRTFYISTNKETNARIIIKTTGKITISASSNNQTIATAGTLTYWW